MEKHYVKNTNQEIPVEKDITNSVKSLIELREKLKNQRKSYLLYDFFITLRNLLLEELLDNPYAPNYKITFNKDNLKNFNVIYDLISNSIDSSTILENLKNEGLDISIGFGDWSIFVTAVFNK